jgi:hypothetical protein
MLNIEKLRACYDSNKKNPWKEWLNFDCVFDKPGKQGLVGLFQSKSEDVKYVFKISQYINYLIQHESVVMNGLNSISLYCPHFCKYIGSIMCDVDPSMRKSGTPFDIKGIKHPIKKEVLLCEYITNSFKLYNFIKAVDKIPEDIIYSAIKQVLMAIIISQKQKKFTHYDLHSNNVMMKKCNKDLVFLYVINDDDQFCVPTLGYYPVIIDFGFSYIEDMDDGPLWPSMAHTDVGFMSDRFDWVADPKLFLVTVSGELKDIRQTSNARKLRRIVRNLFYPLKIDWDSGWDKADKNGASDYITKMLKGYSKISKLFSDYEHYCIDILQTLVITPIEEQSYENIHIAYSSFLNEWVKIENQIESPFYNLYILKCMIDSARYVRAAYSDPKTEKSAIDTFRTQVLATIDNVAKFCNVKNVHYEKILCSLYVLSRSIEGVLYDIITSRMIEKQREYDKLPLQLTEQIYGAIEVNIPDTYKYNKKTTVCIIDCRNGTTDLYNLPKDELKNVNNMHPMSRGPYIWNMVKMNSK